MNYNFDLPLAIKYDSFTVRFIYKSQQSHMLITKFSLLAGLAHRHTIEIN